MMKKFLDMFNPIQKGDFGLTDEAIYKSLQQAGPLVPVYGAYQSHSKPFRFIPDKGRTKNNELITIFNGEGIIINFDGASAGRMTYKKGEENFALNHHAGFFKVRKDDEDSEDLVVPEFFSLFYQKQFQEASVSSDQKTLTIDTIYSMEFDIPLYDIQKKIIFLLKPTLDKEKRIEETLENINSIKKQVLSYDYSSYQATDIPLGEILDCQGGNSGLTEEYLYSQIQDQSLRKYRILTGSTDYEIPQYTHKCKHPKNSTKYIVTIDEKAVIHVVRKGKAGSVAFFEVGNYTLNDDAYLLYLKEHLPWDVDLKWLMYVLKPRFLEYASSSDNGTWNKTGFFRNVRIDLPSYPEQVHIVNVFGELEEIERRIKAIDSKIENLFSRQVVSE